jgi:hypothetical protein
MSDKIYRQLRKHYNEVYSIEPNELHSEKLTSFYKTIGRYLKVFPFRVFVPFSAIAALALYIVFGILIIRLVSILQYGF